MFKTLHNLHYEQIGKEVRCIEDELPFEIPENWCWTKISNFCSILGGKRIPAGKKLTSENTGHIYIRVSDMKNGTVKKDNLKFVPNDIYPTIKKYIINKEDVFITVAGTIGRVGKIPFELDGANLTENADRLVFSKINQDWLIYVLSSPFIQSQIAASTTKVGQPKLAITRIEQILIPLPSIYEQKRIVNKIKELEPLIDKYRDAEEKLYELNSNIKEQLKKSILQYAIEGKLIPQDPNDEPASLLLDRIYKEKQKLITEGKIKKDKNESIIYRRDNSYYEKQNNIENCINNELPFEIPNSWEWIRLGNLTYNHGQKEPNCNFCYIDIGSVNNEKQMLNKNETVLSADKAPSRARKIVKFGDILYSTVRPYLHNMCIINRSFSFEPIASTGFAVLTCHSNYLNEFLFIYMMSPIFDEYANSNENSKGVAYPAINDSRLSVALVPVPPAPEQQKIIDNYKRITRILS